MNGEFRYLIRATRRDVQAALRSPHAAWCCSSCCRPAYLRCCWCCSTSSSGSQHGNVKESRNLLLDREQPRRTRVNTAGVYLIYRRRSVAPVAGFHCWLRFLTHLTRWFLRNSRCELLRWRNTQPKFTGVFPGRRGWERRWLEVNSFWMDAAFRPSSACRRGMHERRSAARFGREKFVVEDGGGSPDLVSWRTLCGVMRSRTWVS